jgi:hypothetical protein
MTERTSRNHLSLAQQLERLVDRLIHKEPI